MTDIYICMGSACYLKGSAKIIEIIKEQIMRNKLDASVHLKGSFCLGPCNQGVVIKVANKFFRNLSPENAEKIFIKEIIPFINENEKEGGNDA